MDSTSSPGKSSIMVLVESKGIHHSHHLDMNPSPLGRLFFIEGILKVLGGLSFLVLPEYYLTKALPIIAPITPSSISLFQSIGSQTLAFSVPLFLASRETPDAVASRRIVYWMMLARESFLAASILLQKGDQAGGFTRGALRSWLWELSPFVIGRIWILLRKKEWFY